MADWFDHRHHPVTESRMGGCHAVCCSGTAARPAALPQGGPQRSQARHSAPCPFVSARLPTKSSSASCAVVSRALQEQEVAGCTHCRRLWQLDDFGHAIARSFIASRSQFSERRPWHSAPGHRRRKSAARRPLPRPRASSAYCDGFHRSRWQVQLRLAAVDNAPGFVDEKNVP
jgi:hypothetical protein